MRLAFSTLACPSWPLDRVLAAARRLGYAGVELRFLEDDDALWARPELTGSGLAATRARLRDDGLAIACVDTRSFFHHPAGPARETALEEARRALELAASLGAAGIRVFGDRIQAGQDRQSTRALIAEALARLAEVAQAHGVEVWIESHGDFARGRDTLAAVEGLPSARVGVVWDPCNAFEVGEAPAEGLRALGARARHVHLKDVGRDGPEGPWRPRLPGRGEFHPERVLALLSARGYDGWVSFEWEKRWHPEIEEAEQALAHFAAWAAAALGGHRR